jgi:VCBS repeat-containing protein
MGSSRARKIAIMACAALLLVISVVLVASAAPAPRTLKYACASDLYNAKDVLHFVSRPSNCKGSGKKLVKFADDYPVYVCRKEHGGFQSARARRFPYPVGIRAWGPAGLIRMVSDPSKCAPASQPNETPVTLPATSSRLFCAAKKGGELRWITKIKNCDKKEFPVKLAKRTVTVGNGNGNVTANPDTGATGENGSTNIDVLANDSGPGSSGGLVVDSTDTTGTLGTVTVNGDNTITYDANGKFESLKAGQTATDTFKYKARKNSVKSADATVTITITGVNDAPVAVDDTSTTDEDHAKTISVLSNDTDAENDTLSAGSLDTTGTQGTVTVNGDGTISYDPNHKFDSLQGAQTASDSFKYKANDGSADSNAATVTVNITAVNDAPVLSGVEPAKLDYLEGSAATPVSPGIAVADVDNANVHGATVTIGTGRNNADALHFANQNGITGSAYNSGTGVLTLTGSATKANYQTALRSITFDSAGGPTGDRTITFQIEDGEAANKDSNIVQRLVKVDKAPVASNDSPTVIEDSGANTIDVLANDSDGGDGGPKTINSKTNGTNGTVAITHSGADLTYTPAANFCGSDSFTYTLNGGSTGTVNVTVSCVNDAPVNTVPGAQSLNEDGNIVFNSAFSVADVDAGGDQIHTTLAVPNGTITVSGGGAGVLTNNGTSSVVITGSQAEINTRLSTVTYAPDPNVNGSRTLTMDTDDQGSFGSGGNKTDHDTVDITIAAVNDAPVNTVPGAQAVDEDTTLTFSPSPQVDDVDAGAGGVKVTIGVNHGTLTLSGTSGLTFTTGDGTNDATMTFTGTVAQVNAALMGLAYKGNLNFNNSDTLTLLTEDEGRTGSGGALSDTDTVAITVNAVNDGPVNTVPATQSPAEDTPVTFSTANGNAFSVSDADSDPGDLKVTLSASHGAMTLSGTAGLTFTTGDGTDDTQMIFTGTRSAINTAINGFTFTPANNFDGLAQIEFKTNDQGNTGSGGSLEDDDIVDLNYSAQNDAPVNTVPSAQSVNEDTALSVPGLSIADSDAGGSPVQVTLSVLNGGLTLNTSGLTFSAGDGSGDATMTFTGTVANINTALGTLSYQGTLNYNGPETLSIVTNDQGNTGAGGAKSDSDSVSITVNPVNDAPTATGDSYSVNEDATLSPAAPGVLGNDSDVDAGTTLTAIVVSPPSSASSFTLNPDGSFSYKGNADFSGSDSFTYKANDGSADSNTVTVNITVDPQNDAPVNTVPGAQTVNEDTSVVLSPSLSIADVDAAPSSVKVTLSALNGGITLGGGTAGLTFTAGDGTGDQTMTFTGTVSDINTALAASSYQGDLNYYGSDTITLKTEDQGNTGAGGNLTDTDTVAVTVNPVNDGPVNTVPGAQTTNEDTAKVFSTANSNALSIADVDAGSASVQVKLTVASGTLTLPSIAGLTFSDGDGTGDATMTFTGSITTINTRLDGLSYQPNSNVSGSDSLQIVTDDLGNVGGGNLTDTDNVAITVSPVNDGPINTVPVAQSLNEDATLSFITSVADVDAAASPVKVSLSVLHGKLTLASTVGLIFTDGTSNNSATVKFTGTLTSVNAAMNSLNYAPDANYAGDDTFTMVSDDQGNTGSGGSLTDTDTVAITVNPVNDAPVLDLDDTAGGTDSNTSFLETVANNGSTQVAPSVSITDVDDDNIEGATIHLDTAPDGAAESLTVNANAGGATGITVTKAYDGTDRDIILSGSDTKAHYKAVLESVTYKNTAQPPNSTTRNITFVVSDGDASSNTATAHVSVIPLNSPPVLDLDTGTAGFDSEATFTEDSTPPSIAPSPSVTDIDAVDTHMESATATITDPQDAALESLSTSDAGLAGTYTITYTPGTHVLSISGHGTKAEYQTLLGRVKYDNTSNTPNTSDRHVQFNVNDGDANSNTATALVHVADNNDAPVNTVPGATSTNEDTAKTFSTANANALSISDTDAGSNPVEVKLSIDNGTLTLASTTNLTFSTGDGTADSTMTFTGTITDINSALSAGVTYNPTPNFNGGPSTLQIVTNDQGNTGAGGAKSDTDTVSINVVSQNDAPVNSVPGAQGVNEDTALVFSSGNGNAVQISDSDAGTNPVKVSLTVANGGLTLNGTAGLSFACGSCAGDGTGDATMTFTGTITNINNALNGLSYQGTLNFNGGDSLGITTDDQGNSGAPGPLSDSDSVAITVAAVDDAPSNTVPGAQSTAEDTGLTFSSGNGNLVAISDVDALAGNVTTTLTATNGTITLSGTGGLSVTGDGTSSVQLTGTLSNVNNALAGMTFNPAANFNGNTANLHIVTSDNGNTGNGGPLSDTDDVPITVTAVNDAPQNTVPPAQTGVLEDTAFTFSSGNGNLISTNDVDSGASPIQVTLSVLHGGMTLSGTSGLAFSVGDGSGDSTMTFTGTLANVNTALSGASYLGTLNYNGPDTITLVVSDQGNTGSGGAKSDTDTIDLTVNPVNDNPSAGDESFTSTSGPGSTDQRAIGNTTLNVNDTSNHPSSDGRPPTPDPTDTSPTTDRPHKEITGDILANDTDVDNTSSELTVTPGTFATNDGGTVTIQSDGDFNFEPAAATSCTDTSDFFDYTVSDNVSSGAGPNPGTDTGRVTVAITGCVWYVNNNDAQGNNGTSEKPFDTTAQAQTASGNNHTTFVYDGDDTTTGYNTGYTMNTNESLISEGATLTIGSDTLHTADAANKASLTNNNADVVTLAGGASVKSFNIDPQGTGGGIFGTGLGATTITLDDLNVQDNGTKGTQPGLELDTNTGTTTNVSNLTVNNGDGSSATTGDTGVKLNATGTVNFATTGTISISTNGARGLDAAAGAGTTSLGSASTFDDITVTNSGTGGVLLSGTTGSGTAFGDGSGNDLQLTTVSGAQPAFSVQTAGSFSVPSGGQSDLSATGGPAVDVVSSSGSTMPFDGVSSTNSANDGINIDSIGTGTFSATSGTVGGEAGTGFDLNGGSGAITYPATFNNGTGALVAEVTGRTGGVVSLAGSMNDTNDAGGGVNIANNTGGSTVFSGATKQYNTGASDAVTFSNSDGHTFVLSGGGSDIDTTSGNGISATTSGTFQVSGSGNTLDSSGLAATNRGLNVSDTDFAAADATFDRISTSGGANGIRLNNTGSAGNLVVTGTGGTCANGNTAGCSGGTIQNTTGTNQPLSNDTPDGSGIVLNNTRDASFTRMFVHDHSNYALRGNAVTNLTFNNSVINGTNGNDNSLGQQEGSAYFEDLNGTVTANSNGISGGYAGNWLVDNNASGALTATMDSNNFGAVDPTGNGDSVRYNGVATTPTSMDVNFTNNTATNAVGDIFQWVADGTGGGDLTFTGNNISNNNAAIANGGGGVTLTAGATAATTLNVDNNDFKDSHTAALTINKSRDNAAGAGSLTATVNNNDIGLPGTANSGSLQGSGIATTDFGESNYDLTLTNNRISQYNTFGMNITVGGGIAETGNFNLNISGNTISNPGTNPSITLLQGIGINSGVTPGDAFQTCVNFGANSITGSSDAVDKDFRLRARQNTKIKLPGYGGAATSPGADTAVPTYVSSKIGSGAQGTALTSETGQFIGGASCP